MKNAAGVLLFLMMSCQTLYAQEATHNLTAKLDAVYVEPVTGRIILSLQDVANPCGGLNFYEMSHTYPIYKQFYSLALTAIATNKPVLLFFHCEEQSPIISHAAILSGR